VVQLLLPSNPKANYLAHKEEIDAAIDRVLDSGWFILGKEVESFEVEFANYIGAKHAVGAASGTDALELALRACDVGPGDEVITVSHTAVATVAAIDLCGAAPVLVDILPESFTLDPALLEGAITPRTKAILPVHLYGHPASMDDIAEVAAKHGLRVIEDCAQSHGAKWKGKTTGTWGDIGAFSFYPTKNLGALGDGGAVVTDDAELAERCRLVREYGWKERYVSAIAGMNTRLDEVQAAILRVKLKHLDVENELRKSLAGIYDEKLPATELGLPIPPADGEHVYHQYVVRSAARNELRQYLKENEIGSLIHYPVPVHRQPAYADLRCASSMAQTEKAVQEILSLPIYPELSEEAVRGVAEAVVGFFGDR